MVLSQRVAEAFQRLPGKTGRFQSHPLVHETPRQVVTRVANIGMLTPMLALHYAQDGAMLYLGTGMIALAVQGNG